MVIDLKLTGYYTNLTCSQACQNQDAKVTLRCKDHSVLYGRENQVPLTVSCNTFKLPVLVGAI